MAELTCPLCCNETFVSHFSLKQHILSMLEKVLCPSCNKNFDNLMELVYHLDNECKDSPTLNNNRKGTEETKTVNIKTEVDDMSTTNEISHEIVSNNEQLDSNEIVEEIVDDPNMIYTCEMCDMTFTSVQEHLAKYHEGEEVLLETEEQDLEALEELIEKESQEDDDRMSACNGEVEDDEFFEENESVAEEPLYNDTSTRSLSFCDSNEVGQEKEVEPLIPQTTKYIVEEGKVRKITEEEAANVSDKSRIIAVHKCLKCNLQFPNTSHFEKHKCSNASKALLRKAEKAEKKGKIEKIKEAFRYQCTFCMAVYTSLFGLNDHMKAHLVQDDSGIIHKKTITMTLHCCDICNIKFPTYKQLRLHSRMHAPVKAKKVDSPVSYNIMGHINHNSKNKDREKFECTICGKEYDKEYKKVHMKYHEEIEPYNCLLCNRKFESKENLDMHTKVHSNTKKFACSYCKKSFSKYEDLEEHVVKNCQKRDFECQYCGRRFAKPHEKVKHERIHTGEKPHVCEVCGKAFRVGFCLTLHMRTHSGNRPYSCDQCGKMFKAYSVFDHHLKSHSDVRNYKCSFCPKAFKTAVQLAGHKNSHTKPFSCTECNRPFASLYAVKAHMLTHKRNNNLKFECWICGASYARSFALRDHMNGVHGQTDVTDNNQVEQALMKVETVIDDGLENIEENQEHQMVAEDVKYQVTVLSSELCQVLEADEEEDEYGVNLQEVEGNVDNQMEVVEP